MSERTCAVDGCDRPWVAREWCGKHYQRWKKYGTTDGNPNRVEYLIDLPFRSRTRSDECLFDGCSDPSRQRGLCYGHYAHLRLHGELRPKQGQTPPRICGFPECGRKHTAHGWCEAHNRQARVNPDAMFPVGNRPRKGRAATGNGYILTWAPEHPNARKSGWALEHVVVMSAQLGRPLRPDENVHHKNGDRADNRLSNLELWSHWQPKGQRVEDKVAWAVELLRFYQPDALATE